MDWLVDLLLSFYGPGPYLIVFGILLLCGLGLPIPEDVTLFAAGLMAYYGICNLTLTIVVCFVGVMVGDSLVYWLGAHYGRKLTKKWFFQKLVPPDRLAMVTKQFHTRGNKFLFAARFMPGLRAPIFFSAGTLHVPFRTFFTYDGLAALISVPLIVSVVFYFGDQLDQVVRWIKHVEHGIVFVVLAAVLAIAGKWYITHRKLKKKK